MRKRPPIPTARDIMRRRLDVLRADADIETATRSLIARGHSGAPVVDEDGALVGVLTEHDSIGVLTDAASDAWPMGHVADHMTKEVEVVRPEEDVFALSTRFRHGRHRRLLVVEGDRLIGLIGRRDLLRALDEFARKAGRHGPVTTYEALEERHLALD